MFEKISIPIDSIPVPYLTLFYLKILQQLYEETHEQPPAEEEETDRNQRVYRGQPSTVTQVQRDRDGIIHQPSVNAIPTQNKVGSFSFTNSQIPTFTR